MTKLVIFVVGGTIILTAGIIWMSQGSQAFGGTIEITPQSRDLGTVSMVDGNVHTVFEVKNTGSDVLKINNVWTSCMCTTAVLKVGDKASPTFGMHANSALWTEEIAPGQKAALEVTFDPALHGPEGVGHLTRVIYLSTSDPRQKTAQALFTIDVNP